MDQRRTGSDEDETLREIFGSDRETREVRIGEGRKIGE